MALGWQSYLQVKTRQPRFLWKMVFAILGAGVVVSFVVHLLPFSRGASRWLELASMELPQHRARTVPEVLQELIDDPEASFSDLLELLPMLWDVLRAVEETATDEVRWVLMSERFPSDQQQISLALWASFGRDSPSAALTMAAAQPSRYANYALAVYHEHRGDLVAAAEAFEQEGALDGADRARDRAVRLYIAIDDVESLARLSEDPKFEGAIDARAALYVAAAQRDWWQVFWRIPATMVSVGSWGAALIAALTGIYWFVFLLQAGQRESPRHLGFWLALGAVGLGMLSIWPTHFFILWQELVWELVEGDSLAGGLRYFILGVGLREELSKLLLFAPLAPILVKRRSELEMLIVAGCVGLGFAVEENIGYFEASFSTPAVTRYLMANFLHVALTAVAGLWLCRAIRWPKDCAVQFLGTFGIVIFAHGLYDAFIVVPQLVDYSLATFIIYVLVAYQFFHELRELRKPRREVVSLTANFLLGVSLLTSITFVYVTANLGIWWAAVLFAAPAAGMGLVVYMFLREMPESMVTV